MLLHDCCRQAGDALLYSGCVWHTFTDAADASKPRSAAASTTCRRRDSGSISDVRFQNVSASTRLYHPSWWGAAEPIYVTAVPRNRSTQVKWGIQGGCE